MATITFTATHEGETFTRTSGTMPYVAITVGSQVQWHKSFAAAHKAAVSRTQTWKTGKPAAVVPAYPTAINGKVNAEDFAEGWGDIPASAFTELLALKAEGKKADVTPADAKATGGNSLEGPGSNGRAVREREAKKETPADDELAAKRAKAAAARRRQRAAAKERAAIVTGQDILDMAVEAAYEESRDKMLAMVTEDAAETPARATKVDTDVATMVLVKVEGKPQARLDTTSNTLVWRNSAKGRAARAAGIWA